MAHYVGPFLGENLLHRVVELQRKVALTDGPAVQAFLQDRFRQIHLDNQLRDGECADSESALATTAAVARTIVTQSIVRGWLFYPLVGGRASPAVAGLSTAHRSDLMSWVATDAPHPALAALLSRRSGVL